MSDVAPWADVPMARVIDWTGQRVTDLHTGELLLCVRDTGGPEIAVRDLDGVVRVYPRYIFDPEPAS